MYLYIKIIVAFKKQVMEVHETVLASSGAPRCTCLASWKRKLNGEQRAYEPGSPVTLKHAQASKGEW